MEEELPDQLDDDDKAQPLGAVLLVSGEGPTTRKHFSSFLYDDLQFNLEDSVLIAPQDASDQKPSVAIIKNITQTQEGATMITAQTFYRPEEVELLDHENSWEPMVDDRELFYSFQTAELHAESVMHKCVVHFLPPDTPIPRRKQNPGFVVRRVYDPQRKTLTMLLGDVKHYEDDQQQQIDNGVHCSEHSTTA